MGVYPATQIKKGSEALYNTELPVVLGKNIHVVNLIKNREQVRKNIAAAGFEILKYDEGGSPDAVINDAYPHRDNIESYKAILFDAAKLAEPKK